MLRAIAWIALVACAAPKPPTTTGSTLGQEDPSRCEEHTFDPANVNCEFECTRTAPQGWPGCEQWTDNLIARGYICQGRTPYACQPSPLAVLAGIKWWREVDGLAQITIDAGTHVGVTMLWTAMLIDRQRLPIGDIALVVVVEDSSIGSLSVNAEMTRAAAGVLLQPMSVP
jgi:hypothetical protein